MRIDWNSNDVGMVNTHLFVLKLDHNVQFNIFCHSNYNFTVLTACCKFYTICRNKLMSFFHYAEETAF